jgi:hypothetical protein
MTGTTEAATWRSEPRCAHSRRTSALSDLVKRFAQLNCGHRVNRANGMAAAIAW